MAVVSETALLEQLHWRYATKRFDLSRKLPTETWEALAQTLVLSPSSYGLQPWKFIVIQDAALRQKLQTVSWNQAQVTECSHYVVFAVRRKMTEAQVDRFIQRTAEVRGITVESIKFYRDMILGDVVHGPRGAVAQEWAARQSYIALGDLMTAAALLGVDACPMEGLDPLAYDDILGLDNSEFATVMACALGYRSSADKYANLAKVRYPASEVIEYR
ncbi:MAG: NAD(P)H-dependent oxidoreductase [Phycisphaerae bacterium]